MRRRGRTPLLTIAQRATLATDVEQRRKLRKEIRERRDSIRALRVQIAELSSIQVAAAAQLRALPAMTAIAKRYGVSETTIANATSYSYEKVNPLDNPGIAS